jgi:DNA polymerase III delta subunit
MVTLIHGSNSLSSYAALKKITDQYDELSVSNLNGKNSNFTDIKFTIETPSFYGSRLVIIDDLSGNRSPSLLRDLKKYFTELSKNSEVLIYERKLLPPESPVLGLTTKIQVFAGPKGLNIFDWADSVGFRKLAPSLTGWESLVISGEDPEYLFAMLIRQFRLLILLSNGERPKVPDFVSNKLARQIKLWGFDELENVYSRLLELDDLNKTGQLNLEIGVTSLLSEIGKLS